MVGSLKTREYYLACRYDDSILVSLIKTAQYKGVTVREVCDTLGLTLTDDQEAKLREMGVKI